MSLIVAILGTVAGPDVATARAMLGAMPRRGDQSACDGPWSDGRSVLAVSRLAWEHGVDFSGPTDVLVEDGVCVAADASLYHRADLRRRLAALDIRVTGDTPSHLILAAYRAWGVQCAARLEGDFAFVVWDGWRRQGMCARDFLGRRGLYYTHCQGKLVVASAVGAVLAYPGCSTALNLGALGATAAGLLWSAGADSAYERVSVLPAAHALVWRDGATAGPTPFWRPPVREPAAVVPSLDDAAVELRGLLESAVVEQMGCDGVTTVWMSGGWDSTAVFAAGMAALREVTLDGAQRSLRPVSISYPEGDPGREDELIRDVASFWRADVQWLDIDAIPLLDGLEERAARSDEPPAHLYEAWNRALARGTRACGARIALDGAGGDQLFQVSDIYLADLLVHGHWRCLARELRTRRVQGLRHIFRNTVEPLLPLALTRFTSRLSGSNGGHYLERPLPSWVRPEFVASSALVERERAWLPPRRARDRADAENRSFLTAPVWAWGGSYMSGVLLEEGVEPRSPLLDRRVVEFALRRPVSERARGYETKILLRRAVRGLLPDSLLAPRAYRTGVTSGYSRRAMRACYPALFADLLRSPLQLAQLGIVDPALLERAVNQFMEHGGEFERVALFHTLKTELWLRARRDRAAAPAFALSPAPPTSTPPTVRVGHDMGARAATHGNMIAPASSGRDSLPHLPVEECHRLRWPAARITRT